MKRSAGRRVGVLMAGALLVAGLAACEPAQFGAAAVVDGKRMSLDQVEKTVATLRAEQAELGLPVADAAVLTQRVVNRMLIFAVQERAAREAEIEVADGKVTAALDELTAELGGEQNLAIWAASERTAMTRAGIEEWLRLELMMDKLGERLVPGKETPELVQQRSQRLNTTLQGVAKKMTFEVNPRYGEFNTETAHLDPVSYDFLVREPLQLPPGAIPGGQG